MIIAHTENGKKVLTMAELSSIDIIKVLEHLVGKFRAVGETNVDEKRLSNLRTLIDVTNWCLDGIAVCAEDRNSFETSVRTNGELAYGAMLEYADWIKERMTDG